MQSPHSPDVVAERDRRVGLWRQVTSEFVQDRIPPARLRELRIYRGGRGIYADLGRTRAATHDSIGATVSVLHLGARYADDLTPEGLTYHFPETGVPGRDNNEILATQAARALELPVFVVTPGLTPKVRWLRRAQVVGYDQGKKVFEFLFRT